MYCVAQRVVLLLLLFALTIGLEVPTNETGFFESTGSILPIVHTRIHARTRTRTSTRTHTRTKTHTRTGTNIHAHTDTHSLFSLSLSLSLSLAHTHTHRDTHTHSVSSSRMSPDVSQTLHVSDTLNRKCPVRPGSSRPEGKPEVLIGSVG